MHSPPRAVSVREQQDWKIPPCISNWKNAKGYTIPLDKRLAADGRGLQETAINDNFAKFTEALYVAESNARQVRTHAAVLLFLPAAVHQLGPFYMWCTVFPNVVTQMPGYRVDAACC